LRVEMALGAYQATHKDLIRGIYLFGPDRRLKFSAAYPLSTGRNWGEVLRVLDSVQRAWNREVFTPCNWKAGDDVLVHHTWSLREAEALGSIRIIELPKTSMCFTPDSTTAVSPMTTSLSQHPKSFTAEHVPLLGEVLPNPSRFLLQEGTWGIVFTISEESPVCASELAALWIRRGEFSSRNCKLVVVSCVLLSPEFLNEIQILGDLPAPFDFPLVFDESRELCATLGILDPVNSAKDGKALASRGTFFVNPLLQVNLVMRYPTCTGRNVDEILRCLDALQLSAEHRGRLLTPENWHINEPVLVDSDVLTADAEKLWDGFQSQTLPSQVQPLRFVNDPTKI